MAGYDDDLRFAHVLADAADDITTRRFRALDLRVEAKPDLTPVTDADKASEAAVLGFLRARHPDHSVLAEESGASGTGRHRWIVDPLDGTKEFLKRNGEFTVNIALIEMGRAVCGVVLAPAMARAFIGDDTNGAYELPAREDAPLDAKEAKPIHVRKAPNDGLIAIASRTHRDTKTDEYLAAYRVANLMAAGSSLKFCMVACAEADLYPRHGRTMEWDTAAGQAVLEAAGGSVKTLAGAPLLYGKSAEGFANPYFIARGAE